MSEELNILTDAVLDVDGNQIAAAGAAVGKSLLTAISEKGVGSSGKQTVAEAGIARDFEAALEDPDLSVFFDESTKTKLGSIYAKLALPEPVFRELETMRLSDPVLYAHSIATTVLTTRVVMEIVMKTEDLVKIAAATLLKDIGMTRIAKPQKDGDSDYLTKQQFHQIRKHPVIGLLLVTHYLGEGIEGMVALRHHMRNGSGYPSWGGLKASRLIDLIEVVDVFYALISPRPFRPDPFDARGAIDELKTMAGAGQISEEALKVVVMSMRGDHPELGDVDLSSEQLGFVPESNFYGTGPAA